MDIPVRYFDGIRPKPRQARLLRRHDGIEIILEDETRISWLFAETRTDALGSDIRLHRVVGDQDTGERLIADAAAFDTAFGDVGNLLGKGRAGEARTSRIVLWSLAAVASLVFMVLVGIPYFARFAAPLVPWEWEKKLGDAIEPQILPIFGKGKTLKACRTPGSPGLAALDRMVAQLAAGADLPGPLRVDVLDTSEVNAFALPGGRILIFRSIIDKAESPDEVAGVLAHEIGHVIHRDAMRAIINDSALSVVVGVALGDISGGFTVGALKTLLGSSYSREHESEADRVSVDLMRRAGADPRAINQFFRRISPLEGKGGSALDLLRSHPLTEDRIKAVDTLTRADGSSANPILSPTEWRALREICHDAAAKGD